MTIPKQHELLKENKELRDKVAALEEQLKATIATAEAEMLMDIMKKLTAKVEKLEYDARQFKAKLQREKRISYNRGYLEGKAK